MSLWNLWNWRLRRGAKTILDEAKADARRIAQGTDEWRRWWRDTGERDFMEVWTPQRGRANADPADSLVAWHELSFRRGGRPPREWIDDF
jgi:hypothetical protein